MKARYIIAGLLVVSTVVFGRFPAPPYDNTKPPSLPLPDAYQIAVKALGEDTNRFHCVGASASADFSSPGWKFTFWTTNNSVMPKGYYVKFDGEVIEDDNYMPQ